MKTRAKTIFTYSDEKYELRFTYGPVVVAAYWRGKPHNVERLRTNVGLYGPFMSIEAAVTHNGMDLFSFETGRKAALRKLMDMLPGTDANAKGLRQAIWDAYLDRKPKSPVTSPEKRNVRTWCDCPICLSLTGDE